MQILPRRVLLAAWALLALVVPTTALAADAVAPSLAGEQLYSITNSGQLQFSNVQCNPSGTSSGDFTVEGIAAGPYPGTFVETGSFTIGPLSDATPVTGTTIAGGSVLSFNATFTIMSGATTVTGTKQLTGTVDFVSCGSFEGETLGLGGCCPTTEARGTFLQVVSLVSYDAIITGPTGTFRDTGTGSVVATQVEFDAGVNPFVVFPDRFETFGESFAQSNGVVRLETPGKATGGGKLTRTNTFGFNARSDANGTKKGACVVVDQAADLTVRCLDVRTYVQVGNRATFTGRAEVNGVETTYRIDIQDNGESGTVSDTFAIQTDTGYSAGGPVSSGNVQVHT